MAEQCLVHVLTNSDHQQRSKQAISHIYFHSCFL